MGYLYLHYDFVCAVFLLIAAPVQSDGKLIPVTFYDKNFLVKVGFHYNIVIKTPNIKSKIYK